MAIRKLEFVKGLSQSSDHMTVPDGALLQMDDWQNDYHSLRPRYGQTIVNSSNFSGSAGFPISLAFYSDSITPTVIVIVASSIYSASYTTDAFWQISKNIAFSNVTGTATVTLGYPLIFDQLNNVVVLCTRGHPIQITSSGGSAAPLAGSPPQDACLVKVVNNICFLSGSVYYGGFPTTTNFSRVWWSNVGDPQTWPAANFIDFRYLDGDYITALGKIQNNLYVFKTNSIGSLSTQSVVISGSTTLGPLVTVIDGLGCAFSQAIDNLPDGRIVFLGSDWNLYIFDGNVCTPLSIANYPAPSIYQKALFKDAVVPSFNGVQGPIVKYNQNYQEVWLFVADADFSSADPIGYIYAFSMIKNSWRRITGMALGSMLSLAQKRANLSTGGNFVKQPSAFLAGTWGQVDSHCNLLYMDNPTITNPTDYLGNTVTASATWSISDPETIANGDFRTIDIPSSNSGSTNVWFGFDGTINGSPSATLSASTIRNTILIPYANPNVRHESMQIQITDTNTSNIIYTPYISDQGLT